MMSVYVCKCMRANGRRDTVAEDVLCALWQLQEVKLNGGEELGVPSDAMPGCLE